MKGFRSLTICLLITRSFYKHNYKIMYHLISVKFINNIIYENLKAKVFFMTTSGYYVVSDVGASIVY